MQCDIMQTSRIHLIVYTSIWCGSQDPFTTLGNSPETNLVTLSEYKANYSHLHGIYFIFDLHNLIKLI